MSNFPPTTTELFETFEDLPEWDERYDFIIDLGRELPAPSPDLHSTENIVEGCMSTVWIKMQFGDSPAPALTKGTQDTDGIPTAEDTLNIGSIQIEADSDSLIVKGLIVVLLAFYHGKDAAEIRESNVADYLKRLGLDQHLSPQRRNGLFSMIKRINGLALTSGTY